MDGPEDVVHSGNDERRGLIPRSLEKLFEVSRALQADGWEYCFSLSLVEIYNDSVRDLLDESQKERNNKITSIPVSEIGTVYNVLNSALKRRCVSSTKSNERSSRSHCITQIDILARHELEQSPRAGKLYLVDLAGSERLKKSGSQDNTERLKEAQNINKSLSCLGDVIAALLRQEKHVPYRNSKLTLHLRDSFARDAKTLLLVNLSPEHESWHETICSLRFASKARSVSLTDKSKPSQSNMRQSFSA